MLTVSEIVADRGVPWPTSLPNSTGRARFRCTTRWPSRSTRPSSRAPWSRAPCWATRSCSPIGTLVPPDHAAGHPGTRREGVLVRKRGVGTQVVQGPITRPVATHQPVRRSRQRGPETQDSILIERGHPGRRTRSPRPSSCPPAPGAAPATSALPAQPTAGDPGEPPATPTCGHRRGGPQPTGALPADADAGVRMKVAKQRIGARDRHGRRVQWLERAAGQPAVDDGADDA